MLSFSLVQTENHKWEYQKLEPKIIFSPKKKAQNFEDAFKSQNNHIFFLFLMNFKFYSLKIIRMTLYK